MHLVFALLFYTSPVPIPYQETVTTQLAKLDSLPPRTAYFIKSVLFPNKTTGRRPQTLIIRPTKNQLGDHVSIPLGVDERTLQVSIGDQTLKSGTDYVFVAEASQVRIVNKAILKTERPLSITYEQPLVMHNPYLF